MKNKELKLKNRAVMNYRMNRLLAYPSFKATFIAAIFLCHTVSAQKQETDAYFSALRNQQPTSGLSFTSKKDDQYIKALTPYLNDSIAELRAEAYAQVSILGQKSQQKALRKKVVNLLIAGWHDADWGIHSLVDNALTRFQPQDFDRTAIDLVKARLKELPGSPGGLFKLIGYLDLRDLVPQIRSYVDELQPPLSSDDRWAGYVAMARLGDQAAVDFILNRVRKLGLKSGVVYDLFPDLVYTRTYRAIHYLEETLFSKEQSCGPLSAEVSEPTPCAYRTMEMLAPAIKDYPVAIGSGGISTIDNYPQTLEKVRAWFKQKNGNYEIIRDTF